MAHRASSAMCIVDCEAIYVIPYIYTYIHRVRLHAIHDAMCLADTPMGECGLHRRHLSQVQPKDAMPSRSAAKAAEAGADFAADFLHRHFGSPSSKGISNAVTCAAQLDKGAPLSDSHKK